MNKLKKQKIFDRIKILRKKDANARSPEKFANMIGIKPKTYEKYEYLTIPNPEIIEKICNVPARKVRPAWVIFNEEPKYVDQMPGYKKPEGIKIPRRLFDRRHNIKLAQILLHGREFANGTTRQFDQMTQEVEMDIYKYLKSKFEKK